MTAKEINLPITEQALLNIIFAVPSMNDAPFAQYKMQVRDHFA
jgi:hypothetical protein